MTGGPTAESVRRAARELGFLACGVAHLAPSRRGDALDRWLAAGYGGDMRYLHRQAGRRKAPDTIVRGARTAVVLLENYLPPEPPRENREAIKVAGYARGRDYHLAMAERLERMCDWLRERGAAIARPFVDAGPVPERELAERAGLGWIGKNTMLIRPGAGSFFFIGSIFTDLALEPDAPFELDRCGSCSRCLEACPTDAFVEPRVLDATRCISYLTIERKGPIPEEFAGRLEGWGFGCDICNAVCPWNQRFAAPTPHAEYHERPLPDRSDPGYFERMTPEEFDRLFADTPFERPGLEGMRRNWRAAGRP